MTSLENMSESEMFTFLTHALKIQEDSSYQQISSDMADQLWNLLSERYHNYAKGSTVVINNKVSLATFLMDLLEIKTDESAEDGSPSDELMDYDIDSEVEKNSDLSENYSFRILWDAFKGIPEITFVIEEYYVDRVYRDSYYTYYSCKHFEYSRHCKRLFIFAGDILTDEKNEITDIPTQKLQNAFVGCVVVRPLEAGKIGRSLLNPYYFTEIGGTFVRNATYDVTMFGKRLYVDAFPYSMQDGETTSCAEITVINLLDYFSKKYAEYRYFLPSEIIDIAVRNGYERRLPTKGLDYLLISKIFMEAGFYPVLYNTEKLEDPSKFKRILHYYIESGIPTAVGLEINKNTKHSIICIGHGEIDMNRFGKKQYAISVSHNENRHIWIVDSADLITSYIVMDDNQKPYSKYDWKEGDGERSDLLGQWKPEYLMVPLYKRMFLEAADAYDICTSVLADGEFGIQRHVQDIGTLEKPVIIRLFMASSRGLKKYRINSFSDVNHEIRERYINTPFPRFVWVCEAYLKEDYPECCIGEVIIDATSAPNVEMGSVILVHYPGMVLQQLSDKKENLQHPVFRKLELSEKFSGYKGNLYIPHILPQWLQKKCLTRTPKAQYNELDRILGK